jgi:hypothetical protein
MVERDGFVNNSVIIDANAFNPTTSVGFSESINRGESRLEKEKRKESLLLLV